MVRKRRNDRVERAALRGSQGVAVEASFDDHKKMTDRIVFCVGVTRILPLPTFGD